jgi:hypothetical protein
MADDMRMNSDKMKGSLFGLTALAAGALAVWVLSDDRRKRDIKRRINQMKDKSMKLKDKTKDYVTEVKHTMQEKADQIQNEVEEQIVS